MHKNKLLDEREKRTVYRKLAKEQFDSVLTLANGFAEKRTSEVRLLDEGALVGSQGEMIAYITKGTLQNYYDAIPDDFVGTVDLGHADFASFPFILGEWTKKDLSLVDTGDGRMGLNVKLHLDENSVFVRELKRMPYDLGVSAEFKYKLNYALSEEYETDVINFVDIYKIGIVGDWGNVNSGGLKLQGGEDDMSAIRKLMGLEDKSVEVEETKAVEPEQAEVVEEAQEEAAPEAEETPAEETVSEGEPEAEETAEEETEDGAEVIKQLLEEVKKTNESIAEKDEQIEALASKVMELEGIVAEYKQKDKDMVENLKGLSLALNPNLEEEVNEEDETQSVRYNNSNDGKGVLV